MSISGIAVAVSKFQPPLVVEPATAPKGSPAATKESANGNLQSTDWYVTRKSEAGTAIPSATSTYRTKVRTASKTIEDKINGCSNLSAFKALFDTPVDSDGNPTGNAPIYDWPKSE